MDSDDPLATVRDGVRRGDVPIVNLLELMREHPEYVFGTVWVLADIAEALFDDEETWDHSMWQSVRFADDVVAVAETALADFVFDNPYGWRQAVRDRMAPRMLGGRAEP
jgi:hypothetical protein